MQAQSHVSIVRTTSVADAQAPVNGKVVVAIVVSSLELSGGVQSIVDMLVRQIERSETHDYLLVALATSATDDCSSLITKPLTWLRGPTAKNVTWRGRKMVHVGCALAELEFLRYRRRKILKGILSNCDLVQVVSGFPAWGATVIGCGKPVAVWAATRCVWERRRLLATGTGIFMYWRRLMTKILTRLDDLVIRDSDAMMVMNPLMREYVATRVKHRKGAIVYAPPGVDISAFSPVVRSFPANGERDDRYILSVGRFGDPRKNPELLLDAFALLKNGQRSPLRLILAGATAPSVGFWQRVSKLGLRDVVIFYENPDGTLLKELYQGALCFALPSDEEGFGMVIVEAMACGIPVVSTRCGGPDGIITDGQDGYLVDVGDAAAIANRLHLLSTDHRRNRQMGLNARQKVETSFSESITRKVFFDTWDRLQHQ